MSQVLTHAERARTLAEMCGQACLSTLAVDPEGTPYGSLVLYAPDPDGQPILLLSALAEHTANLGRDPRAS
ncbi:MAG: pyridoxamine 5'-phosphate oxidase family protein, partial [Candidatus Eremiobacterota bacterium]